jgi:GNAT superfamily N-acetyltransferase
VPIHGLVVRELNEIDVPFAAALHAGALPHGFFAELGDQFLAAYYRSFIDSPHATALVAALDGQLVGVLVGPLRPGAHRRWIMRQRGARLALIAAAALATRPTALRRFLATRVGRYGRVLARQGRVRARDRSGAPAVAVLTHVAVLPTWRGQGIGTALVERFVRVARAGGADEVHLVTLSGATGAEAFYRRLGWAPARSHRNADGALVTPFRLGP